MSCPCSPSEDTPYGFSFLQIFFFFFFRCQVLFTAAFLLSALLPKLSDFFYALSPLHSLFVSFNKSKGFLFWQSPFSFVLVDVQDLFVLCYLSFPTSWFVAFFFSFSTPHQGLCPLAPPFFFSLLSPRVTRPPVLALSLSHASPWVWIRLTQYRHLLSPSSIFLTPPFPSWNATDTPFSGPSASTLTNGVFP